MFMAIHKFYQADENGKVTVDHKFDEKNIVNELRRILNDIATTFGQTKLGDGLYPKDDTQGLEFDTNRIITKTGTGTLTIADCGIIKLSATASYTLYLPTAVGNGGRYYCLYKSDDNSNLITINAYEGETINGLLTYTGLNYQYAFVILKSNDVEWIILSYGFKNVTDDAQLKREAGDLNSFEEKTPLLDDDIILIEDSVAGYAKKKAKVSSLLEAKAEMGKVLAFNYDGNGDVMPAEDPGPMDIYHERDENNDLMPIENLKVPNTINFYFEIDTNGDIEPREV
jgi:hypothetical protein